MKIWMGLVMSILGVLVGAFIGLYVMFYGGIVQVVHSLAPINAGGIALGIVRIVCAGFIGTISAVVLLIPGITMMVKEG
jgi:hypothetical protein